MQTLLPKTFLLSALSDWFREAVWLVFKELWVFISIIAACLAVSVGVLKLFSLFIGHAPFHLIVLTSLAGNILVYYYTVAALVLVAWYADQTKRPSLLTIARQLKVSSRPLLLFTLSTFVFLMLCTFLGLGLQFILDPVILSVLALMPGDLSPINGLFIVLTLTAFAALMFLSIFKFHLYLPLVVLRGYDRPTAIALSTMAFSANTGIFLTMSWAAFLFILLAFKFPCLVLLDIPIFAALQFIAYRRVYPDAVPGGNRHVVVR